MQVLRDAQKHGYKVVRGNWDENVLAAYNQAKKLKMGFEVC